MSVSYFQPGEHVLYRSYPNAEPEVGTVVRDTITGLVFVDYGHGRVMATRREDLLDSLAASPEEPGFTGAIVIDANQTTWTAVAARKQRWRGDFCGEQRAADWLDLHHPVLLVFGGHRTEDTPEAES